MYLKKIIYIALLIFLLFSITGAQNNSISPKFIYISSSKIFLFPESPDLILRKKNLPIENILGVGIEYRKMLNDEKYGIGVNIEYLRKTIQLDNFKTVDGFWSIPIELTGFFFIPLGLERWKFFMGGGLGAYFGGRIIKKENTYQESTSFEPGFGIHILGGSEYFIYKNLAFKLQLKFRDLHFQTKNRFYQEGGDLTNTTYIDYNSKISVDGTIIELGILFTY